MATFTYLVVYEEALPSGVLKKAENTFDPENVYKLTENTLLLRTQSESPTLLRDVLDISGASLTGVVFKLDGSYSGYHYEALWDWLKVGRHG